MPDDSPLEIFEESVYDTHLRVEDCEQIISWISKIAPVSLVTEFDTIHANLEALVDAIAVDVAAVNAAASSEGHAYGDPSIRTLEFTPTDPTRMDAVRVQVGKDIGVTVAIWEPNSPALAIAAKILTLCRSHPTRDRDYSIPKAVINLDADRLVLARKAWKAKQPRTPIGILIGRVVLFLTAISLLIGLPLLLKIRSQYPHVLPKTPAAPEEEPPAEPASPSASGQAPAPNEQPVEQP